MSYYDRKNKLGYLFAYVGTCWQSEKQPLMSMDGGGGEVLTFTGSCAGLDNKMEVERTDLTRGYHDVHIHSTTGGKTYDYSATRVSEQMVHLFGGHGDYHVKKDSQRPKLSLEERAMLESIPCRLTRDIIFSTITRPVEKNKGRDSKGIY
jgi:hypothetical protein